MLRFDSVHLCGVVASSELYMISDINVRLAKI